MKDPWEQDLNPLSLRVKGYIDSTKRQEPNGVVTKKDIARALNISTSEVNQGLLEIRRNRDRWDNMSNSPEDFVKNLFKNTSGADVKFHYPKK